MTSETTRSFRKAFDALPVEIQQRARVTRSYRALAIREGDHWIWFWIGTHADYDRLVASL